MNTQVKGSTFGGAFLIAGCCIGAGTLALPIATGFSGFLPATLMFICGWFFMASTGLLLLETVLWFGKEVNIPSIAQATLGFTGKAITWGTFLFLFYSLMIAYISGGSAVFTSTLSQIFSTPMPTWIGSLLFIFLFGIALFLGTRVVDTCNRILVLGLVITYALFVIIGAPHLNTANLSGGRWDKMCFTLPVILTAFGFHQIVPTLATYMQRDARALKRAIIIGSFLPFLFYVVWEALILGIVPMEGPNGILDTMHKGLPVTSALHHAMSHSYLDVIVQYFAFFALTSTFLSVALGFVDFLADGLQVRKDKGGTLLLCCLVLLPPMILSLVYPDIFLTALNYAGGIGATILFGILPPLMVWVIRYRRGSTSPRCLPGGRVMLVVIILCSLAILSFEVLQELGFSPLPTTLETSP
jgi:tyrosine-specific transport protein